jgi:hypothetical protein
MRLALAEAAACAAVLLYGCSLRVMRVADLLSGEDWSGELRQYALEERGDR